MPAWTPVVAAAPTPYARDPDETLGADTVRSIYMFVIGSLSRLVLAGLNRTEIHHHARFLDAFERRAPGTPLITVSNHVAAADDPWTIAMLVPATQMADARRVRWGFCATDRCFKGAVMNAFFRTGKVLPIERGAGIGQQSMLDAMRYLARGDWVHVFPEGTRSRDGRLGAMKPGIGALAAASATPPVIVPFFHVGMQRVQNRETPIGRGHTVHIVVGEPVECADLVARIRASDSDADTRALYAELAERVGRALRALEAEAHQLAAAEGPSARG